MNQQSHEHLTDLQLSILHDAHAADFVASAHVHQCESCEQRLSELRSLSLALNEAPLPVLSQIARARVRRNVLSASVERGVLRLAEVFGGVAAAVLVGGLLWLSRTPAASQSAQSLNSSAHATGVERAGAEGAAVEAAPPWVDASAPLAPKVHNVTDTPAARWYLADTASHVEESL